MASQIDVVDEAIREALRQIEQNAPEAYQQLNAEPDKKVKIIQAARDTATETLKLTDKFRGIPTKDITKNLSKHLSEDRINLIKGGLKIPTFRLTITKQDNGQHLVEFTREGKMFQPSRAVATVDDVDWAHLRQYASIVVEVVLLVLSVVGLSIHPEEGIIREVIEAAAREFQNVLDVMEDFVKSWNAAEGNTFEEAAAIFNLLRGIFQRGILFDIIQRLCSGMSWFDWLFNAVKVIATLVASFATEGFVLIAEISIAIIDMVDFAVKIANVNQLSEIKKTL